MFDDDPCCEATYNCSGMWFSDMFSTTAYGNAVVKYIQTVTFVQLLFFLDLICRSCGSCSYAYVTMLMFEFWKVAFWEIYVFADFIVPQPWAAVSQLPAALRLPQKKVHPCDFWAYPVDFVDCCRFHALPGPLRLCCSCLRRFGSLRKNTSQDFWSLYLGMLSMCVDFSGAAMRKSYGSIKCGC